MVVQHRNFYDSNNLKLILTDEEILRINSNEVQQLCDQFDQSTIVILQQIDENFSKSNQILNERILPSVQKHGENSQQIWESIKFWRSFFEAAANTKLNEPGSSGEESFAETEQGGLGSRGRAGGEGDSISFEEEEEEDASSSSATTPRPIRKGNPQQYSDDLSPFQALKADLNQFGIPSTNESNLSAITQAVKDVHRLRLGDLPPDSPDLPEFELENLMKDLKKKKGKERAYEGSPKSKISNSTGTGTSKNGQQSDLLHNLLRKNLSAKKPSVTTTTTTLTNQGKLLVPSEIPDNWNGIADLSITPLTGLVSPIKRRTLPTSTTALKGGPPHHPTESSPLPSMSFALSPHPYSQTPTKDTARKVARDIYNYVDSPLLEPPSVLKNWASRGYDDGNLISQPSPSEGMRKGFEEEAIDYDQEEDSFDLLPSHSKSRTSNLLADFGGGTTARIDDLLGDESFGKIEDFNIDEVVVVDEEGGGGNFDHLEEREPQRQLGVEEEINALGDYSFEDERRQDLDQDEEEEEGMSREYEREGPEDTLFGMPQRSMVGLESGDTEDSFAVPGGGMAMGEEGQFRVLGRSEMDTLYGGNLLESEPFEASPLANRRK